MNIINPFKKSILFFTFHKCASTLFSDYVIPNIKGYIHKNPDSDIYNGKVNEDCTFTFKKNGYIYGPMRISVSGNNSVATPIFKCYKKDLFASEIGKMKSIFFIRDPRDMLISEYFSFKYSHGMSKNSILMEQQKKRLQFVNLNTIDEYALSQISAYKRKFTLLTNIINLNNNYEIIKYEDMINNFIVFSRNIRKILKIDYSLMNDIYNYSRPNTNEEIDKHKRSGKVSQFKSKLRMETVKILNVEFEDILNNYGYLK